MHLCWIRTQHVLHIVRSFLFASETMYKRLPRSSFRATRRSCNFEFFSRPLKALRNCAKDIVRVRSISTDDKLAWSLNQLKRDCRLSLVFPLVPGRSSLSLHPIARFPVSFLHHSCKDFLGPAPGKARMSSQGTHPEGRAGWSKDSY